MQNYISLSKFKLLKMLEEFSKFQSQMFASLGKFRQKFTKIKISDKFSDKNFVIFKFYI